MHFPRTQMLNKRESEWKYNASHKQCNVFKKNSSKKNNIHYNKYSNQLTFSKLDPISDSTSLLV